MQLTDSASIAILGSTGRVSHLVATGIGEYGAHVADGLAACDAIVYVSDLTPALDPSEAADIGEAHRCFDAAAAAVRRPGGPRRLVVVTSAFVYGAHANNPIPLSENAVLRPNEDCTQAAALGEIERRVDVLMRDVPDADVTVLRPAPVLDPRAADPPAWLVGRAPFRVRNAQPPRQFVHPADLASAILHTLAIGSTGRLNVAPDGWLTTQEVDGILDTSARPSLPADASRRVARRLRSLGLAPMPSVALDYMQHSIVVSNSQLASSGFACDYGNARALRVADGMSRRRSQSRLRPRARLVAVTAVIAGLLAMRSARRRRRAGEPPGAS